MPKKEPEARRRTARRELAPGELPRDALEWLARELIDIDRLITEALETNPR